MVDSHFHSKNEMIYAEETSAASSSMWTEALKHVLASTLNVTEHQSACLQ